MLCSLVWPVMKKRRLVNKHDKFNLEIIAHFSAPVYKCQGVSGSRHTCWRNNYYYYHIVRVNKRHTHAHTCQLQLHLSSLSMVS